MNIQKWRKEILRRDGYRCAYCDSSGKMEIEHIVPVSKGGTHTADNIVPACRKCNLGKTSKDLRTWLQDEDRYQFICDMRSLVPKS